MDYQLSNELLAPLRELLDDDVTQTELAEQVQISYVTLSLWLRGRRVAQTPRSLSAVRRLCRRVGVKFEKSLSVIQEQKAA
jgi:transcriptional regulator with XRE-family HTH domain